MYKINNYMSHDNSKKVIIFSDLDGSLLDSSYSFVPALDAIRLVYKCRIPLVLCSSKTRAEIEKIRDEMGDTDPFISENGGGIFIPGGYFASIPHTTGVEIFRNGEYTVIKLGATYRRLREALSKLKESGFNVTGFGDMSPREVGALTGLDIDSAERAKKREFDEPFVFSGTGSEKSRMIKMIHNMGLQYTEGEYCHILGGSDKGRAVRILKEIYRYEYGEIITIALGDGLNDVSMLREVDIPVLIKKSDGSYDSRVKVRGLRRAEGIGPEGWGRAVKRLLNHLKLSCSEGNMPSSTSLL